MVKNAYLVDIFVELNTMYLACAASQPDRCRLFRRVEACDSSQTVLSSPQKTKLLLTIIYYNLPTSGEDLKIASQ